MCVWRGSKEREGRERDSETDRYRGQEAETERQVWRHTETRTQLIVGATGHVEDCLSGLSLVIIWGCHSRQLDY